MVVGWGRREVGRAQGCEGVRGGDGMTAGEVCVCVGRGGAFVRMQ